MSSEWRQISNWKEDHDRARDLAVRLETLNKLMNSVVWLKEHGRLTANNDTTLKALQKAYREAEEAKRLS